MKDPRPKWSRRLLLVGVVGVLAIGGAVAFRQRALPAWQRAAAKNARARELEALHAKLQAAVTADPKDKQARWELADYYQKLGLLKEAGDQLEAIVGLDPADRDARIALGNARLAAAQFPEAEAAYQAAAERWPDAAEAWQGLAASRYHQRRYLEASRAAREAHRLEPAQPNHRYTLATSLLEYALQYPDPMMRVDAIHEANDHLKAVLAIWQGPEKG
ncbi:MAG: tetratricopeptide repeat protein, partial [Gemmatimonadota bacterium]